MAASRLFPAPLPGSLFGVLALLLALSTKSAHASASYVAPPPAEMDELTRFLADAAEAARNKAWVPAQEAARASTRAWTRLRDAPEAGRFPPILIWRLDALESRLTRAIATENVRHAVYAANEALRFAIVLRRHFRQDRDLVLEKLRAELREMDLAALTADFRRAERARKRASFLWERLKSPLERRARMTKGRLQHLGTYFDLCFEELGHASREHDAPRLRRAARSALDLTETLARLANRPAQKVRKAEPPRR